MEARVASATAALRAEKDFDTTLACLTGGGLSSLQIRKKLGSEEDVEVSAKHHQCPRLSLRSCPRPRYHTIALATSSPKRNHNGVQWATASGPHKDALEESFT